MLVTVVPRMGWLAEVLGVEGLALAAGAARGQYDVAAGARGARPRAAAPPNSARPPMLQPVVRLLPPKPAACAWLRLATQ